MYVLTKIINADGQHPIFFYAGSSTDPEPTGSHLTENSQLIQNDTGVKKYFHNGAWELMANSGGSGGGPVESPFFDVEFSNGGAGWAPNSVTIAQILAAKNAGKIPRAIVELNTGTYAYGFICTSVDTQEEKGAAFSVNVLIEGSITNYVFSGVVDNGADVWSAVPAQYLPDPDGGFVGDVVTIDLDEDGETHIAAWKTPQ